MSTQEYGPFIDPTYLNVSRLPGKASLIKGLNQYGEELLRLLKLSFPDHAFKIRVANAAGMPSLLQWAVNMEDPLTREVVIGTEHFMLVTDALELSYGSALSRAQDTANATRPTFLKGLTKTPVKARKSQDRDSDFGTLWMQPDSDGEFKLWLCVTPIQILASGLHSPHLREADHSARNVTLDGVTLFTAAEDGFPLLTRTGVPVHISVESDGSLKVTSAAKKTPLKKPFEVEHLDDVDAAEDRSFVLTELPATTASEDQSWVRHVLPRPKATAKLPLERGFVVKLRGDDYQLTLVSGPTLALLAQQGVSLVVIPFEVNHSLEFRFEDSGNPMKFLGNGSREFIINASSGEFDAGLVTTRYVHLSPDGWKSNLRPHYAHRDRPILYAVVGVFPYQEEKTSSFLNMMGFFSDASGTEFPYSLHQEPADRRRAVQLMLDEKNPSLPKADRMLTARRVNELTGISQLRDILNSIYRGEVPTPRYEKVLFL